MILPPGGGYRAPKARSGGKSILPPQLLLKSIKRTFHDGRVAHLFDLPDAEPVSEPLKLLFLGIRGAPQDLDWSGRSCAARCHLERLQLALPLLPGPGPEDRAGQPVQGFLERQFSLT